MRPLWLVALAGCPTTGAPTVGYGAVAGPFTLTDHARTRLGATSVAFGAPDDTFLAAMNDMVCRVGLDDLEVQADMDPVDTHAERVADAEGTTVLVDGGDALFWLDGEAVQEDTDAIRTYARQLEVGGPVVAAALVDGEAVALTAAGSVVYSDGRAAVDAGDTRDDLGVGEAVWLAGAGGLARVDGAGRTPLDTRPLRTIVMDNGAPIAAIGGDGSTLFGLDANGVTWTVALPAPAVTAAALRGGVLVSLDLGGHGELAWFDAAGGAPAVVVETERATDHLAVRSDGAVVLALAQYDFVRYDVR